jgi:hypothetical protein
MSGPAAAPPLAPPLFAGLCDDAALFPPGDAPVDAAVPAHRRHRSAWYAALVGPFLLGPDRIAEVAAATAGEPLEVVLVVRRGPAALADALAALARRPALRLVGVELGPDADGAPADAAGRGRAALDRELPPGVTGVVELRRGDGLDQALDRLADSGYRAKYRTGGLEPSAFPTSAELAAFVTGCAARGLAFKCTAGLHRAVRHTDPATGLTQHGFLNVLAAADAALRGEPQRAEALLDCRDGGALAAALGAALADGGPAEPLRALFTAYGTCSVTEPLTDLAALGLITRPDPAPDALDHVCR